MTQNVAETSSDPVDRFCELVRISPVEWNNKIDTKKAVYHKITEIRDAIRSVLGNEKQWLIGRSLRESLVLGVHFLEKSGASFGVETVYALTREGVEKVFQAIEKSRTKSRPPRKLAIELPIRN